MNNPLLDDFLYQAIYQPNTTNLAPKSIINKPELQVYIKDFGKQKDDYCFCAEVDNRVVGAVWVRNTNGYGSIDEDTVEFAISVFDKYQKMGIGTALMNRMLEHLKEMNYPKASLATVYKGNIIKNLIMDCQSYTKYRPNETTGGIFVSWRRKEELPTGA